MELLLRAACHRLVAPEPPCCEPESLAAETGVDPETARALLPGTDAVLKAVAESALRRQMDHLTRRLSAAAGCDNPAHQLVELGKASVEWAIENRDDYTILNLPSVGKVVDSAELQRYHGSLQELARSMLERARERGQVRTDADITELLLIVRAFSYGLSRLYVDRQLRMWLPDDPDLDRPAMLNTALEGFADMMLTGWREGAACCGTSRQQ
ncbi:WHG domain-containing protein [Paracoccus sp. Z118]|uniref:WHG domain-containing protein n=1 Tax=Paracoccus sp. Z118 TaxID=2851017 RepID=UPI001C2BBBA6|nr:WHG domain-containing protein [Paracoccus sp. Z118]MBV0891649.1 WHG domain-containing protein [Paracoccus sp. Z118]